MRVLSDDFPAFPCHILYIYFTDVSRLSYLLHTSRCIVALYQIKSMLNK